MNTKTIFTLILLFVFFSCNKHTEQDTQADGNVSITIKKFQPGLSTKTAIDMVEERGATIWAENDCVGVFSAEGIQGSLIIKSGVGTNTATFVTDGHIGIPQYAYYPYTTEKFDKKNVPVNYTQQLQSTNASVEHLSNYDFMAGKEIPLIGDKVNFVMEHLGCLVQLKIWTPTLNRVKTVTICTDEETFVTEGTIDLTASVMKIEPVKKVNSLLVYRNDAATTPTDQEININFMMVPVDMTGKKCVVKVVDVENRVEELPLQIGNLDAGKYYQFTVRPANLVTVDYSRQRQRIEVIGGDMERSQHFLVYAKDPQQVADWCFKDIPFNVCRVSYDKKQELIEGDKNMGFYNKAVEAMKMVKKANPNIKFWATMKSDYNGYEKKNNLPDWICNYNPTTWFDCDKYGIFLADYLEYMESQGVGISYLAVSKEWTQVITAERAKKTINKVIEECAKRNIKQPLFVDPASWSISQGVKYIKDVAKANSMDLYYAFSTHNLNDAEKNSFIYEEFVAEASKYNKPAIADESPAGAGGKYYGVDPATLSGILSAYKERADFYKDGIQGEIFFELFSRGVEGETRRIYFEKYGEAKRMRSYFVMKEFSIGAFDTRYIEPTHFGVSSSVHSMAFANDDKLFIVLLNESSSPIDEISVVCDLDNREIVNVSHVYFDEEQPTSGTRVDNVETRGTIIPIKMAKGSISFITVNLR